MRVVLDTNTVVSALLFSGVASRLLPLWQSRRITVLLSKEVFDEYVRVLADPKFELSAAEVKGLLEDELLPFVETVRIRRRVRVRLRDPDDRKFLDCAVAGRARFLVTGDPDLLELRSYRGITILRAGDFLGYLEGGVSDPDAPGEWGADHARSPLSPGPGSPRRSRRRALR